CPVRARKSYIWMKGYGRINGFPSLVALHLWEKGTCHADRRCISTPAVCRPRPPAVVCPPPRRSLRRPDDGSAAPECVERREATARSARYGKQPPAMSEDPTPHPLNSAGLADQGRPPMAQGQPVIVLDPSRPGRTSPRPGRLTDPSATGWCLIMDEEVP